MNVGKKKYDQIPVSDKLDQVIWDAIQRDTRETRAKRIRKWILSTAAVFVLLFASANIMPVYAYASQIPVVGTIVRILHIGDGGNITDGAHAGVSLQGDVVDFTFESEFEALDAAPSYSVMHLYSPNRLVLTLRGVRSMDTEEITQSLLSTDAVWDVYRAMIGDDSMYCFVIVMNSGYTYEITEYTNPGILSVRFCADTGYQKEQRVFYLRTEEMPYGERLGLLCEKYYLDGATQLRTQSGNYIVTVGQYSTEAEAKTALAELEERYGSVSELFVSSGLADEIP